MCIQCSCCVVVFFSFFFFKTMCWRTEKGDPPARISFVHTHTHSYKYIHGKERHEWKKNMNTELILITLRIINVYVCISSAQWLNCLRSAVKHVVDCTEFAIRWNSFRHYALQATCVYTVQCSFLTYICCPFFFSFILHCYTTFFYLLYTQRICFLSLCVCVFFLYI